MRPSRKARGGSIPGVFDRRATPRGGMQRWPNVRGFLQRGTSPAERVLGILAATETRMPATACSGCGLVVDGGTTGCRALFDELLARHFGDVAYFRVHRLMVDTYSLQHPDTYCVSPKSLAAHLTGLCWLLEHGGSKAVGSEALRRWLDGTPQIEKPAIPSERGRMTVADVQTAPDAVAYAQAVEGWATSTWEAYAPLHALAHQWIQEVLTQRRVPRH